MPLPAHITSANDLVTSEESVAEGFLVQAKTKTRKASPMVQEALRFWKALQGVTHLTALLSMTDFKGHLLAAAGFSDKALNHLSTQALDRALRHAFDELITQAGDSWREEVLARYLLTKGDTLGGAMRNVTGAAAQTKFSEALIRILQSQGHRAEVTRSAGKGKIQKVSWLNRRLLFDKTPTMVGNNVDVILLKDSRHLLDNQLLDMADRYIACGELKGGIDPAGADEHWKTAKSALERIRAKLGTKKLKLFFVGAAIAQVMADEIFKELRSGQLQHAANLNCDTQVNDLVEWLVSL